MDTCFPWGYGSHRVSFDCVDDRSRFAIARMYERKTPENAVDFLHYVIAKSPFVIRAVRTDRGTEFGKEFDAACALAGIEHIRNDAYSPEQNGKIEKFHDVYKQRCFFSLASHPLHPLMSITSAFGSGYSGTTTSKLTQDWEWTGERQLP